MINSQFTLPIAAAFLIVAGSVYQGLVSNRWMPAQSEKLTQFTTALDRVPKSFGNWVSEDTPVDQKQFAASNCDGYVSRRYVNVTSKEAVDIFLVSGSARHVTIHTPDWCYVAAGYEMLSEPVPYDIETVDGIATFRTANFYKEDPTATYRLRIFWGYTDNGTWESPAWQKWSYAGRSAMYKLYMISSLDEKPVSTADDPAVAFAQELLPVLKQELFRTSPRAVVPE